MLDEAMGAGAQTTRTENPAKNTAVKNSASGSCSGAPSRARRWLSASSGLALSAGMALALVVAPVSGARAGGYPVIDTSSIAQLKTMVTHMRGLVSEFTEVRAMMGDMLSAFGEFGVMPDVLKGTVFAGIGSESDFYANMAKYGFDPCAINLCQSGDNPAVFTDIAQARAWTMKNLFVNRRMVGNEQENLMEVRRRAVAYTASNALGLSKTIHGELIQSGTAVQSLETIIAGAADLRGDVRANSAVALAQYKAQLQQIALLTAMVDVASTRAIRDLDLFDPEGGDTIPTAIIDTDFVGGNLGKGRVRVTQPARGSASGGGSSLGGSLLGAALGSALPPEISSILRDTPIGAAVSAAAGGSFSGILGSSVQAAGAFGKGDLFSDALSVAGEVLRSTGNSQIASAVDLVGRGVSGSSATDQRGNFEAILGLGSMVAQQVGDPRLSSGIALAGKLVRGGGSPIDFAKGVATDIGGADPAAADWLSGRIKSFEGGAAAPESLLLDAAYASARQADPTGRVAAILQGDPAGMASADVIGIARQALDLAGSISGNKAIKDVSAGVARISDQQLADLSTAASNAWSAQSALQGGAAQTPGFNANSELR